MMMPALFCLSNWLAGCRSYLFSAPTGLSNKALRALARELHSHGLLPLEEGLLDGTFASAKKGGLAVGPTKRGKGTKIMAIAAVTSLPLAVTVDSASPRTKQNSSRKP